MASTELGGARMAVAAAVRPVATGMRPFRLNGLPANVRPAARLALGAIAAWCVVLLFHATGSGVRFDPWSGSAGLMNTGGAGPTFLRVATLVSVAIALAAAAAAVWEADWETTRAARIVRRVLVFSVASVGLLFVTLPTPSISLPAAESVPVLLRAVWSNGIGWAGMIAALTFLLLPRTRPLSRRLAVPLAAAPVVGALLASLGTGELTRQWQSLGDWRADRVLYLVDSLELLLVLFLAWEVVAWTELVAGASAAIVRRLPARPSVAARLLTIKLAWLGAGLAGVLPAQLGGHAAVWDDMRSDGPASWVLAAVLAGAAAVAVGRRRGPAGTSESLAWRPLLFVLAALLSPGLVAGVIEVAKASWPEALPTGLVDVGQSLAVVVAVGLAAEAITAAHNPGMPRGAQLLLVTTAMVLLLAYLAAAMEPFATAGTVMRLESHLPFPDPPYNLYELPGRLTANYFVAPAIAFVTAAALAIWGYQSRKRTSPPDRAWVGPAVFAVAFAGVAVFYVLPHLSQVPVGYRLADVGVSGDVLAPASSYTVNELRPAEWVGGWNGPGGTFEVASFDAALTVALGGLAWRRRRSEGDWWPTVAFVLLASTAIAHSATIAPGGWVGNHWYYAAFVVPVVWQLVLYGDELNELAARRPGFVLLNLSILVILLTVVGYRLLTSALDPTVSFQDAAFPYGRGITVQIIVLPLGALAVNRWLRERTP